MTDGSALLKAVLANPDEDTPRLVYADWLQESGQEERAEFIRAQVWLWANPSCGGCTGEEWMNGKPCDECDKRHDHRVKANDTLDGDYGRNWRHWVGDAIKLVPGGAYYYDHLEFSRGFLGKVICTAADWLVHADAILAQHPVREVKLTTMATGLDLHVNRFNDLSICFADSPRWPGVEFVVSREVLIFG